MISLESEYNSIISPPSNRTMFISASKASYLASLLMVENPNRNDFSIINFSGLINTTPTPAPFRLEAPSV